MLFRHKHLPERVYVLNTTLQTLIPAPRTRLCIGIKVASKKTWLGTVGDSFTIALSQKTAKRKA
jgi:hypothetical protein